MEESLSEYYYRQLKESKDTIPTMVNFYKSLFEIVDVDSSIYQTFGRLINIYGKELIFFSLLDCADVKDLEDPSNIRNLISYFAKKRLEERYIFDKAIDLTDFSKKNMRKMGRKRRLKIPKVFDE